MPLFRRRATFDKVVLNLVTDFVENVDSVAVENGALNIGERRLELGDIENHYRQLPSHDRDQWLEIALQELLDPPPIPDRLETTRPLRPGLRPRSLAEAARLTNLHDAMRWPDSPPRPRIPYETFGGEIITVLLWDNPTTMSVINENTLETWGARFDDLLPVGIDNLADQPTTGWSANDGHVWSTGAGDDYGGSRLLEPTFFHETDLQGEIVIIHPHRDLVLATVAEDVPGIQLACERALDELEAPHRISCRPLVGTPGNWRLLNLPSKHPASELLDRLAYHEAGLHYGELRGPLVELVAGDIHVADYSVETGPNGRYRSTTTWHESTPSLLPRTDAVKLVNSQGEETYVAWKQLHSVLGPAMEETRHYPELHRVSRFPTKKELAQLRSSS